MTPKWDSFKEYIDKLLITLHGKKYGPIFFKGTIKDIHKQGHKYPIHELVSIVILSVINYSDLKILKPKIFSQDSPDVAVEWGWEDYKADAKQARRRAPISSHMRIEIFQRDKFRCHYCKRNKEELPRGTHLTLDHKIPYSGGGDDSFNNLVTACSECNGGKSNKIVKDI